VGGANHHAVEFGAVPQLVQRLALEPDHAHHVSAFPGSDQEGAAQRFGQAQLAQIAFGGAGLLALDVRIECVGIQAETLITQVLVGAEVGGRSPTAHREAETAKAHRG